MRVKGVVWPGRALNGVPVSLMARTCSAAASPPNPHTCPSFIPAEGFHVPRVDLPVADGGEVQPVVAPGQIPYAAVVSAQYGQLLVEQRREYDDVLRDSNPNNREGKKLIYGLRALLATMAKMYEGRQGGDKGTGLRPGSLSSPCPPSCRWAQCHTEPYLYSVPDHTPKRHT